MEIVLMCGTPILAVFLVLGLFIITGFLIDPEGMVDWWEDLKRFYGGGEN